MTTDSDSIIFLSEYCTCTNSNDKVDMITSSTTILKDTWQISEAGVH